VAQRALIEVWKTYLADTPRVHRALATLFGRAVGKDVASWVWALLHFFGGVQASPDEIWVNYANLKRTHLADLCPQCRPAVRHQRL
jgi:hypothetical protein